MADDSFQWVWELVDRVSSPGKNVAAAYERIDRASKAAAKGHDSAGSAADRSAGKHESLLGSLMKFDALKWVFNKVIDFAKDMSSAITFKQESLIRLKTLTGSAKDAGEMFEWVSGYAAKAGLATQDVMGMALAFAKVGFNVPQMKDLTQLTTDISAMMGKGAADTFAEGFAKINQSAQIMPKQLKGITDELGITEDTFKLLSQASGMSVKDIRKQWSANALTPLTGGLKNQVMNAIYTAAKNKVDPNGMVGQGTLATADLLPRAIQKVESAWHHLLARAGDDNAMSDVFTKIADVLMGPTGDAIVDTIKQVTGAMKSVDWAGVFQTAATAAKGLVTAFGAIADAIGAVSKLFNPLADKLADVFNPPAGKTRSGMDAILPSQVPAGTPVTSLQQPTLGGMAAKGARDLATSIFGDPSANVVQSSSGGPGYAAGDAYGRDMLEGYDKATRTNSPSAEWALRGRYAAQGYQMGLAQASTQPASVDSSRTSSTTLGPTTININVNSDGNDATMKDTMLAALTSAFEQLGIEGGGV